MTDDLPDRLRRVADRWGGGPVHAELVQAADEIDRLRAENDRFRANDRSAVRMITEAHLEIERPRSENPSGLRDSVNASDAIRRNLKRLRRDAGLTAAALGDRLAVLGSEITAGTIGKFESGHRARVYDCELLELAAALEVPISELFAPPPDTPLSVGAQSLDPTVANEWVRGLGLLRWSTDGQQLEYWTLPNWADQLEAEAQRLRAEHHVLRRVATAPALNTNGRT